MNEILMLLDEQKNALAKLKEIMGMKSISSKAKERGVKIIDTLDQGILAINESLTAVGGSVPVKELTETEATLKETIRTYLPDGVDEELLDKLFAHFNGKIDNDNEPMHEILRDFELALKSGVGPATRGKILDAIRNTIPLMNESFLSSDFAKQIINEVSHEYKRHPMVIDAVLGFGELISGLKTQTNIEVVLAVINYAVEKCDSEFCSPADILLRMNEKMDLLCGLTTQDTVQDTETDNDVDIMFKDHLKNIELLSNSLPDTDKRSLILAISGAMSFSIERGESNTHAMGRLLCNLVKRLCSYVSTPTRDLLLSALSIDLIDNVRVKSKIAQNVLYGIEEMGTKGSYRDWLNIVADEGGIDRDDLEGKGAFVRNRRDDEVVVLLNQEDITTLIATLDGIPSDLRESTEMVISRGTVGININSVVSGRGRPYRQRDMRRDSDDRYFDPRTRREQRRNRLARED